MALCSAGQRELADHAGVATLERHLGRERKRQRGGAKQRSVVRDLDLVGGAAVVEAGLALDAQAHLAADADDPPDEVALVVRIAVDGHEVLDLGDTVGRQEAGDEDVRVGEVELLDRVVDGGRGDPVEAAALLVEDRGEHARRVESRRAVPVDRAVRTDEGDRVEVADDPVLRDGKVVGLRGAMRGHGATLQRAPEAVYPAGG